MSGVGEANLPERVLQFGTGRFLLGFLGEFLYRANRAGAGGAAVVVQSTGCDRAELINRQGGRYTLVVRGMSEGSRVEEQRVLSGISRALCAETQWEAILDVARSPALEIVVSNTTEAGLTRLAQDQPGEPKSFPAKLTALLVERFRAGLDGLVVLPCELVEANGALLQSLVEEVAASWQLQPEFSAWLKQRCMFPNTLVDRIVTGVPPESEIAIIREHSGFEDRLVTVAEPYALWAIEGSPELEERIWFARSNPAIVIAPDITRYRELKVRLLNGGHSACAALAMLSGFRTVGEAMSDPHASAFIGNLLRAEIGPTLSYDAKEVENYIAAVLDRWRNPFLEHAWRDIAAQYTAKLRARLVPTIERSAAAGTQTDGVALGLAAYLRFVQEERPLAADPGVEPVLAAWDAFGQTQPGSDYRAFVERLLADRSLWGADLSRHPRFASQVAEALAGGTERGFRSLLEARARPDMADA